MQAKGRRHLGSSTKNWQRGGVALEYLLVTIFAASLGVSLLGIASQVFQKKLARMSEEAGIDLDEVKWNPLSDGP